MNPQWEQRPIQKNRRQVLRRIEAHLCININEHGYDMNWLVNRAPSTQHRFPLWHWRIHQEPETLKLHRRKRKDHKLDSLCWAYVGRLKRSRQHSPFVMNGLPIKAESGYYQPPRCIKWGRWDIKDSCRAHTSRHSSRDCTAEFIEWVRRQQPLCHEPTSNQSNKGCHKSNHPQSANHPVVKAQMGQNQTINRTTNKENKVRARFMREEIHYYFLKEAEN